jgi:hypothetical protein
MVPQIELIGVDEELRGRVEGIVTLQLGSSMVNLSVLKVTVAKVGDSEPGRASFRCELNARLERGTSIQVVMLGSGVHICVADATARLARLIKKQVRTQHVDMRTGRTKQTVVV